MTRGYLLDTNVLSATGPDRRLVPEPAKQAAREWIRTHEDQLWLPGVAIGEIAAGIGEREGAGATQHAAQLSAWLRRVLLTYPERVLGFGLPEALCCRQLALAARQPGVQVGFADMAVASIAVTHELSVVTRNTKHFAAMNVEVVNCFET